MLILSVSGLCLGHTNCSSASQPREAQTRLLVAAVAGGADRWSVDGNRTTTRLLTVLPDLQSGLPPRVRVEALRMKGPLGSGHKMALMSSCLMASADSRLASMTASSCLFSGLAPFKGRTSPSYPAGTLLCLFPGWASASPFAPIF